MSGGITLKEVAPASIIIPASGKDTIFIDSTVSPPAPAYKDSLGITRALTGPTGAQGPTGLPIAFITDGADGQDSFVPGAPGINSPIQVLQVTLTDAQIKALPTTPITIVAAPISGSWIHLLKASLSLKATAGAYTNINATFASLRLETDSTGLSVELSNDNTYTTPLIRLSNFLGVAANNIVDLPTPYIESIDGTASGQTEYIQPGVNTHVKVDGKLARIAANNNGSGNFTGGNAANTLKVTIYYAIEVL